jgi:hypothetical protein
MSLTLYVKLAVWAAILAALAPPAFADALKVRFQLADDVFISGELTAWDADGFDGSFGRRLWTELKVDETWRLYQKVMDQQAADQWVNLGRVLLLMSSQKRAATLAEQAFNRALRIDESAESAIEAAREQVAEIERKRRESQQAADAARLHTISPEGRPWTSDPWPLLSDQEQKAALAAMKADAERILKQAGIAATPLETDHFLLYTDVARPEAAPWVIQLERARDALGVLLSAGEPPGRSGGAAPQVWGKVVVLVFKDQDRFRLVEAESFKQLVPQATIAVCHPSGPKAFVCMHKSEDGELLQWEMVHETVHALLHRHRSPRRLPAWANEGLAEYVTGLALRNSSVGAQRRAQGLRFIRDGRDVNAILGLSYADQTWPGPDGVGLAVGGLLVELLLRDQPREFVAWLDAVKTGQEWEPALRKKIGAGRAEFAATASQYYKVND